MAIRRSDTVIHGKVAVYQCISRCVRRAYLCGVDHVAKKSFEHRRGWLLKRIQFLLKIFSVEVLSYALMSNHYHLLVRTTWEKLSDEEVVRRWLMLYPDRNIVNEDGSESQNPEVVQQYLRDREYVGKLHERISSISWFMKSLNEFMAVCSNREDGCKGRFWEGRFECQRLEDEGSLLLCSAYIDLNPVRAKMADTPEASLYTSAWTRIQALQARHELGLLSEPERGRLDPNELAALAEKSRSDEWLCPIDNRVDPKRGFLSLSTQEYLIMLDWTGREVRADKRGAIPISLEPILTRLKIRTDKWVDSTKQYGSDFYRIVGNVSAMIRAAKANGKSWLRGVGSARMTFASE